MIRVDLGLTNSQEAELVSNLRVVKFTDDQFLGLTNSQEARLVKAPNFHDVRIK